VTRIGGPLVLDLILLGVGEAVLLGLGVVRSVKQALRYAGLAFIVGWCTLGAAIAYALIFGASLQLWQPIALAAALAAPTFAFGRVIPAKVDDVERQEHGVARACAIAAAVSLIGYLALLGLHSALTESPTGWDTWAFWLPRAKAIFSFDGLHPHLHGGFASFAHPEYPPLVPAFDATVFRFAGAASVLALPFQDWLLAAAFVGATAAVLRCRVRPAVLWPALCLLVLAPQFGASVGAGYADPQLARLIALAAVCGGIWVLERDGRLLALTGILLVGASLTKREGVGLALMLSVALAVAARVEGGRGWARALLLVPTVIVAALPWQIWLHVEQVRSSPDYNLRSLFHPDYLSDRLGRLSIALEHLPRIALSFDHWLLVLPLALLLALLVIGTRSSLAVLVLGSIGAGYLGLACVYWIGTLPVTWYMRTSASRVVASLVLLAGALTPLLAGELLRVDQGQDRQRPANEP
jgi:hypothetical protein